MELGIPQPADFALEAATSVRSSALFDPMMRTSFHFNAPSERAEVVTPLAFRARPQVRKQSYRSAAACQRTRRRRWQQAKRPSDADYRENQARAQRAWAQGHRGYWREYRRTHPQYCESNRDAARRRQRDRRHAARFAKMHASRPLSRVPSGTYRIVPADPAEFAKMDAWIVEMTLISMASEESEGSLQKTT